MHVIIRILSYLPLEANENSFITKLIKIRKKNSPDLFDDPEFLSYVYKKKIGIELKSDSITTLALRSSIADYSFYSPLWTGAYNLGLTSSDLFSTYHLYKNFRINLPNLKNVIVFFSVPAPGYSLINSIEGYRTIAYKYFFNIPYSTEGYIKPEFEKRVYKKCNNLKISEVDSAYWGYEKKSYYGIDISAQERVRTHLRENIREPDQMNWLSSLSGLVNSDGRRLFVVIPPVRSDYKNLLPSDIVLYEKLFKLESEGLEIINLFNSDKFNDTDFGDTDHLNNEGAIKMTGELKKIFLDKKIL